MVVFRFCSAIIIFLFLMGQSLAASHVYIASAPKPKEINLPPKGFTLCQLVAPGFEHGIWHDAHRICHYDGPQLYGAWTSGYWQCDTFDDNQKTCTQWQWRISHFEDKHSV